jgi:hypothetical protein
MRALLVLLLVALPKTAAAWACGDQPRAQLVSPGTSPAPLNARIRLWLEDPKTPDAKLGKLALSPPVALSVTRLPGRVVELAPKTRLSPQREYQVLWPSVMNEAIGHFRTGDSADTRAPELPAGLHGEYVDLGWVLHYFKQDAPATIPPARMRAWPYGFVDVRAARDDRTPEQELWFGAWLVDESPGAERAVFRKALGGALRVGDPEPPYECSSAFEFPFPKPRKRVLMAIAAYDLAGNASAPHYFVLDPARRRWKEPPLK